MRSDFKEAINEYAFSGVEPSYFVRALLENNLTNAILNCETDQTLKYLVLMIHYIRENCPDHTYGSKKYVDLWIDKHNEYRTRPHDS